MKGLLLDGCLIEQFYVDIEDKKEKYDEEWTRYGEELRWDCFAGFDNGRYLLREE